MQDFDTFFKENMLFKNSKYPKNNKYKRESLTNVTKKCTPSSDHIYLGLP